MQPAAHVRCNIWYVRRRRWRQLRGKQRWRLSVQARSVIWVGFATAQNAQDRIAGVNDVLEGTDLEMVEVLLDDVKPEVALSNAQTAIQKYGDELAASSPSNSTMDRRRVRLSNRPIRFGTVKASPLTPNRRPQVCTEEGVIQAMIGQRVFFYALSKRGYVMNAMSIIGEEETRQFWIPIWTIWAMKVNSA
ncbi:MAG: hypothetical protein R2932_45925 [Caldilineaceae bacterium]